MGARVAAAVLSLTMCAGLAPAAALASSPATAPSHPAPPSREVARSLDGPEVTRTGTVHRVVTKTRKRETLSTVLRSAGQTIPLRGAGRLEPGRQSVTGVMTAGRLHVTSSSPTREGQTRAGPPAAGARAAARPAHGRERSLILPVKYNSPAIRPGDYPFVNALGSGVGTWLRRLSGGRYSLRATVAPWLVLAREPMCGRNRFQVLRWAKRAARTRGIDVGSFDRFLVYQRCPGQSRAEAMVPGTVSWYYGKITATTAVHELGHNLGLLHATRTTCRRQGEHSMFRGRCRTETYGDSYDVMGDGALTDGFNAASLRRLGWPSNHVTAARSGSWQLSETQAPTGDELEALRIPGENGTSTWIQAYRASDGVVVRRQSPDGTTSMHRAHDHWYLGDPVRPGTSVTTPEGVRIAVAPVSPEAEGTVSVRIDDNAPPPSAPGSPERVRVTQVSHQEVRVAFDAPLTDNGAPVHHYEVSMPGQEGIHVGSEPDHPTTEVLVPPPGGDDGADAWTFSGLKGREPTHVEVTAVNEYGASVAGRSETFTPIDRDPVLTLESPVAGQRVSGSVTIESTITDSPDSTGPTTGWELMAVGPDGEWPPSTAYWSEGQPAPTWDTTTTSDGPHTLWVRAGEATSAKVEVIVDNPSLEAPTLPDGSKVAGRTRVPYEHETPGWVFQHASAELRATDGSGWYYRLGSTQSGEYVDLDLTSVQDGPYALTVYATGTDPDGETLRRSLVRQVVVDNVEPKITALSPAPGTVIRRAETRVRYTVDPADWPRETFAVLVSNQEQGSRPGEPLTLDVRDLPNGRHYYQVISSQEVGYFYSQKVPFIVRR